MKWAYTLQGGQYRRKFFAKKFCDFLAFSVILALSAIWCQKLKLLFKNEKTEAFEMTSYVDQCLNCIWWFTIGWNGVNYQNTSIENSTKRNQIKVIKRKYNLKNNVSYDGHKIICDKNLKKNRRYWAFSAILAHSAILAVEVLKLKNVL